MRIEELYLKRCRAIHEGYFSFGKKNTALIGPNGSGKTTVLEALYYFVTGKSFRATRLEDMVARGEEQMSAALLFEYRGVEKELTCTINRQNKLFSLDREPVASFTELFGTLVAVLLSTEDSEIIRGAPEARRAFLNGVGIKVDPLYLWHLSRYGRALRQRNIVLKKRDLRMASLWEEPLSISGAYLTVFRAQFIEALSQRSLHYFSEALLGEGEVFLRYRPASPFDNKMSLQEVEKALLQEFQKVRNKEGEVGYTLLGPHRDDFSFMAKGMESRAFASEGEKQLILLSIKLAEADFLKEKLLDEVILFIDEFGLHLDKKRRRAVLELLPRFGQVILTATDGIEGVENTLRLPVSFSQEYF